MWKCLLCLVGLTGSAAWGAQWSISHPQGKPQELYVYNPTNQDIDFWVDTPPGLQPQETSEWMNIAPLKWKSIQSKRPFLTQIKSQDKRLQVYLHHQNQMLRVPEGRSRMRRLDALSDGKVEVINLSPLPQKVEVKIWDLQNQITTQTLQLAPFELKTWTQSAARSIEIVGQYNLYAQLLGHLNQREFFRPQIEPLSQKNSTSPSQPARFVVADPERLHAFVVEIQDPLLVQQARDQIQFPMKHLPRILVATLQPQTSGLNQNRFDQLRGTWSWEIDKVIRFADFGSQACNGSPESIEDQLPLWLELDQNICLWNYRIVEEIDTVTAP